MPVSRLVGFADVVLTGRVAAVAAGWDAGTIYTYVTLKVGDVLKGWLPERQMVVKQLGGRVGDRALVIDGQASFAIGEDVLLFLEIRPRDRTLSTTALSQGKWTLAVDAGGERIARRDVVSAAQGPFGALVETVSIRALREMLPPAQVAALRVDVNVQPRDAAAAAPVSAADAPLAILRMYSSTPPVESAGRRS